ncbi:MAG: hypothetical protein LPJ87_09035 [Zoogloeaceae bacterium]|nr:hypothetical protein [Zoogloeaceae bacterium]
MTPILRSLTAVALITLLAACSKLTAENYNKIKLGQTFEEVQGFIGKPDQCDDVMTARVCTWGKEGGARANVSFVGNKVVLFSAQNLR